MNKPVTLCDHCDMRARCLLNYDGVLCQKNRSVEPTNADRIRAMSDEELAAFLDSIVQDWYSGTAQIGGEIIVDNWLAWLQLSTRPQQRKRKRECKDWNGWKRLKE